MKTIKPIFRLYAAIAILLATNVCFLLYITSMKRAEANLPKLTQEIDSLKQQIKIKDEIYKKNINSRILTDAEFELLQSAFEKETKLSRLRDSLESALSKKHSNK